MERERKKIKRGREKEREREWEKNNKSFSKAEHGTDGLESIIYRSLKYRQVLQVQTNVPSLP